MKKADVKKIACIFMDLSSAFWIKVQHLTQVKITLTQILKVLHTFMEKLVSADFSRKSQK